MNITLISATSVEWGDGVRVCPYFVSDANVPDPYREFGFVRREKEEDFAIAIGRIGGWRVSGHTSLSEISSCFEADCNLLVDPAEIDEIEAALKAHHTVDRAVIYPGVLRLSARGTKQ